MLPGASRVTMALRSLRPRRDNATEANKTLHVEAGGGEEEEEEPLRQECVWIGRGSFSNGGGNPPNVQLGLYKMSPDKQSHSCGVPKEVKV